MPRTPRGLAGPVPAVLLAGLLGVVAPSPLASNASSEGSPAPGQVTGDAPRPGSPSDADFLFVEDPPFTVLYQPQHERLALHVLASAPVLAERLPAVPSDWVGDEDVRIYLAPDGATFRRLTRGRAPEWSAGVALPRAGIIILPLHNLARSSPRERERVLRHELAHVALHRTLDHRPIPRWFDEGYARWAGGHWDRGAAWELRLAFALRRGPALDSLALGWPAGSLDAGAAYLLSASAVAFLVERSGEYGLQRFLERWSEGGTMEAAFRETYGMTIGQFEGHWRRTVRRRYGWTYFMAHSVVFWFFVGLLLLWLYGRRRRRDAAKLAYLRATELPDSPAYWLGDSPPLEPPSEARGGEGGWPSISRGDAPDAPSRD